MTKFKTSDRNDQTVIQLDDAALDAVVGGNFESFYNSQLVGGWGMPIGTKSFEDHPVLGRYIMR
jgi:hypothetical protein